METLESLRWLLKSSMQGCGISKAADLPLMEYKGNLMQGSEVQMDELENLTILGIRWKLFPVTNLENQPFSSSPLLGNWDKRAGF